MYLSGCVDIGRGIGEEEALPFAALPSAHASWLAWRALVVALLCIHNTQRVDARNTW